MPEQPSVNEDVEPGRAAVFFDRDGTLIYDREYMARPAQVELLPGAIELLDCLSGLGFLTVVVSNQSGVGRGLITPGQADAVHRRFTQLLADVGVVIDTALYCPHAPDVDCLCRKPQPGLLLQAAEEHNIDLSRSFMIGDKVSDCEAGLAAGCKSILFSAESRAGEDRYETVRDLYSLKRLLAGVPSEHLIPNQYQHETR
jgi:D-glycero-D-manno-heptose 1,7-bisphosphate phosphatase